MLLFTIINALLISIKIYFENVTTFCIPQKGVPKAKCKFLLGENSTQVILFFKMCFRRQCFGYHGRLGLFLKTSNNAMQSKSYFPTQATAAESNL